MACKITILLLSESQVGTIGNDWTYSLEAKIFNGPLVGQGTVSVPKHTLDSGQTQGPPGPPKPLVLPAGEPGTEATIDLRLQVAEVDALMNDTGEMTSFTKRMCPAVGEPPFVEDRELAVGVTEEPSGIGNATFTLGFRLTIEAE